MRESRTETASAAASALAIIAGTLEETTESNCLVFPPKARGDDIRRNVLLTFPTIFFVLEAAIWEKVLFFPFRKVFYFRMLPETCTSLYQKMRNGAIHAFARVLVISMT